MDVRKLRKIVELLHEFDIAIFKLRDKDSSVQITRKAPLIDQSSSTNQSNQPAQSYAVHSQSDLKVDRGNNGSMVPSFINKDQKNVNLDSEDSTGPYSDEKVIKSPMVGTFYTAASPDSNDFIQKGQKIEKGDMVCIIEAMKIMNRIESDRSGVVKEILVKNGDPVQFGQALVVLE